ncbi:hypothetical protein KC323_g8421 [Hortaea werneckii]|nr:hypothetical protein KC323_g8421 [Hortaea werneckii]
MGLRSTGPTDRFKNLTPNQQFLGQGSPDHRVRIDPISSRLPLRYQPLPSQESRRRYYTDDTVRPDDEVVEQQDPRSDSKQEMNEKTDTDSDHEPSYGCLRRVGPRIGCTPSEEEETNVRERVVDAVVMRSTATPSTRPTFATTTCPESPSKRSVKR